LQEQRCIKDLSEYLLSVCTDKDAKKKLKPLLQENASNVGLLVCGRFVNFPYELVPKLYDSLFDEVSWATEDEVDFLFYYSTSIFPYLI
jgi:protein BCP1